MTNGAKYLLRYLMLPFESNNNFRNYTSLIFTNFLTDQNESFFFEKKCDYLVNKFVKKCDEQLIKREKYFML